MDTLSYLSLLVIASHTVSGIVDLPENLKIMHHQYNHLKQKLHELKVIPEVLHVCTKHFVNVTWPSGVSAQLGNVLTPSEIQQKPALTWPYIENKEYVLLFTDMDDLYHADALLREYQLWMVYNIPRNDIEKGTEAYEYILPDLREGPHRVAVLVFQQRQRVNVSATTFGEGKRGNFAALEVLYDFNGSLHASNVFIVKTE